MTTTDATAHPRPAGIDALAAIERAAATPLGHAFGSAVAARLGDREQRDSNTRTVPDLLAEAIEQAIDLSAWATMAYEQTVRQGTDDSTLDALRQQVIAAGVAAATAHVAMHRAMDVWKRARQ